MTPVSTEKEIKEGNPPSTRKTPLGIWLLLITFICIGVIGLLSCVLFGLYCDYYYPGIPMSTNWTLSTLIFMIEGISAFLIVVGILLPWIDMIIYWMVKENSRSKKS